MNILVVNAGSSTIKFNFFKMKNSEHFISIASGVVSHIGEENSKFKFFANENNVELQTKFDTHEQGIECFLKYLKIFRIRVSKGY